VVDIFTQLDRLSQVYVAYCVNLPVSLPSYCYQDFVEVVELQVINLASALAASVPALPPSVLQRIRRGSSFVRSAASGSQGSASSESPAAAFSAAGAAAAGAAAARQRVARAQTPQRGAAVARMRAGAP
jgi:type IV secretory pathway VirB6-like protein